MFGSRVGFFIYVVTCECYCGDCQAHRLVVVDDEQRVEGILSLSDLFHLLIITPYSETCHFYPRTAHTRIHIVIDGQLIALFTITLLHRFF